jgi:putative inorganic carbon (HCO3(-)) transporter
MKTGFYLYLIFVCSWFLHLSARLPFLGVMHIDLVLIMVMTLTIVLGNKNENLSREIKLSKTHKVISLLLVYTIVTLPFVEWPGSVIHTGFEKIIKAIVFYYFTMYFITDKHKLKLFIAVFLGCQSFRFLEPVYLHITEGYWGSGASMANWEIMDRLSGAPSDVVNPNGLAFIILTVIPFYYYFSIGSLLNKLVAVTLIPVSIYALLLTGSRSGLLGLFAILLGLVLKSRNKVILISIICIAGFVSVSFLSDNFKDRYLSIFNSDTKNASTAKGRTEGVKKNFIVALRRPLFGHGLGTSREANVHFMGEDLPSHNLYTEIAEELGFIGLFIFLTLIKSIIVNYSKCQAFINSGNLNDQFLLSVLNAMQVWLYMNILFSFASYGLSSYEWYLFAGLSVVMISLCSNTKSITIDKLKIRRIISI